MADEELDRDWKPNGRRPQSTIARSFSQELMDIFRIENSISDLDQQVDERRQNVDKNTQELASIEQRIREMEARLNRNHPRPALSKPDADADAASSATANGTAAAAAVSAAQPRAIQQDKDEKAPSSRPGTARAAQSAPGSGIMPPTPGASEDGDHDRE